MQSKKYEIEVNLVHVIFFVLTNDPTVSDNLFAVLGRRKIHSVSNCSRPPSVPPSELQSVSSVLSNFSNFNVIFHEEFLCRRRRFS